MIEIETAWGVYNTHGVADAVVLDADGDTTISAPTDDQIDVEIGGTDVGTLTATTWTIDADIDLTTTGNRIDLDTDNDTSIRASADDTMVFECGGTDIVTVTSGGNAFKVSNNVSVLMDIEYAGNWSVFRISNFGSLFELRPRVDGACFEVKNAGNSKVWRINTAAPRKMEVGVGNADCQLVVRHQDNTTAVDSESIQIIAKNTDSKLLFGCSDTSKYGWIQAYDDDSGSPAANDIYLQELGGSVVIGGAGQIATSATDGFLYIPSCAGAPSGTPTDHSNASAIVHDTTNNRIYLYDHVSGAWQYAALT